MKNLTITLPEEVARWARVRAARLDLSVSRMVAEMLRERMAEEAGYQAARRAYLGRKPVVLKERGGYPARDELHDRDVLR